MSIRNFIETHYQHFNAAALKEAAQGYEAQLKKGNQMMVTLAGAMSTAELGISLAEMIRQEKVHAISCTGANLEEDLMHLMAKDNYVRVPHYRELSGAQEKQLLAKGLNRVTDTCIPEEEAFRDLERELVKLWKKNEAENKRKFPHEVLFQLIESGVLKDKYQKNEKDSWLVAAYEKNIPIFVPGWEDSTTANIFTAHCIKGDLNFKYIKSGVEYMIGLADWYRQTSKQVQVGFFQIGGGIAGDFPICVVPMLRQDMEQKNTPLWAYFCQISDSTTSYGSYSGAVPNEKISWGKLDIDTPKFIIESDATIVAPLIFAYLLEG